MMKRLLTGIGLIGCLWIFAGCAEVVVPGTIAGGGEYYRYTTGSVAKRTFVSNVGQVTAAARKVLKTMDIQYHYTSHEDSETEMKASTDELDITIFLTPITATTTQVHVSAAKNSVFNDKATADEILDQIKLELERKSAPDNAFPKVFVKNDCHRAVDIIVYYLDGKNGPASWQTRGWFSLAPGQKKYVADTHNRYIYFYGETRSENKTVWTGNLPQWFEGRRYNFFKVDMGTALVDYTHAFSCD
jgi:galactitol-specific phosphotransferase system IIB component